MCLLSAVCYNNRLTPRTAPKGATTVCLHEAPACTFEINAQIVFWKIASVP